MDTQALMRVGGKVQIRSHQFARAHFGALTLFCSHVFNPLNRGCFGARNAGALRALCVIGTPALPGQAVRDAQTQARRGGGDGEIRKLVLDRLRQSEGAILLLLFAAEVVAAVRFGRGE